MVITRSKTKDLGKHGTGGNAEGVVPGRDQAGQQGLPGRHQTTDCRVEIVPINTVAAQVAVDRMEHPQNINIVNNINNNRIRNRNRQNFKWTNDKKLKLLELYNQAKSEGRGFMKRLKEKWDNEFPDVKFLSEQNLRDSASKFKKDKALVRLELVQRREGGNRERNEANLEGREDVDGFEAPGVDVQEEQRGDRIGQGVQARDGQGDIGGGGLGEGVGLTAEEQEIEIVFVEEMQRVVALRSIEEKERKRLSKVVLPENLVKQANNILKKVLVEKQTLKEIVDAVYAMGKTLMRKLGVKEEQEGNRHHLMDRRERKKRDRIKELRQWIARISNELNRRKGNKSASKKEKMILLELRKMMKVNRLTKDELLRKKEAMLDEMRYQQATLRKMLEKGQKIKDNKTFSTKESLFYRKLGKTGEKTGDVPNVEEFVDFWGNIWEDGTETPMRPWMEAVGESLNERVWDVEEFRVRLDIMSKQIKKRKNWTAPGADGIQNYWWKKLDATWPHLVRLFQNITEAPNTIPRWFPIGRTVLLSKTNRLNVVSEYRPITCLNTIYKIYTGVLSVYMKDHAIKNNLWDDGQLGAMEGVLGTVDQLLVDECIMQQVRQCKRNLAVAYYDYKKAYDMVHHDWMIRVYRWMGIPENVCRVLVALMNLWKTKLVIYANGEKQVSRWISILKGFLQGDSYSPVGFCLTEVPIAELVKTCKGFLMGLQGEREIRRTHSLFIDDFKGYAKSEQELEVMNEMIVKASSDTGAVYGVKKCAEVVYKRGKMVKGEGLQVLEERMQALDPAKNEFYKFLGCEQANGIDVAKVLARVKDEIAKRMDNLLETKLSDKNLMKAINSHVLPVAGYIMNVCKISETDLTELDMIIKRKLRGKMAHGRICSDERLYMHRRNGGRGLKSLREIYRETKTRIACYLALSDNEWMNVVWRYERSKDNWSLKKEVERHWQEIGEVLEIGENEVRLNGAVVDGSWRVVKEKLKKVWKERSAIKKKERLVGKEMQGKAYARFDSECHHWLNSNIEPQKVSSIIEMQERMVETRAWKRARGIDVESDMCRLCGKVKESVDHILAGCEKLAGSDYLRRHNNALMVFAIEWGKSKGLVEKDTKWYEMNWKQGTMLENKKAKLIWDFEFKVRKTTRARRPDLVLEDLEEKKIFIVDMACPMEENVEDTRRVKLDKYRQVAFEMRERRRGFKVWIVPLVIGAFGGGCERVFKELKDLLPAQKAVAVMGEMNKVVLWESESMLRRVLSGITQE